MKHLRLDGRLAPGQFGRLGAVLGWATLLALWAGQMNCFGGRAWTGEVGEAGVSSIVGHDDAPQQASGPQQANVVMSPPPPAPAPAHATFIGRTLPLDALEPDSVRMAWSGVSAGVRFRGTTMSASLGDAGVPAGKNVSSIFDVVVDGNQLASISVAGDTRSYTLAQGLAEGEHTLWLTKRTDCDVGVALFRGFAVSGNDIFLVPPARPARHLMVIGSSTEVGFGVTGTDQNCATGPIFVENQSIAWPQLAANQLGADLENLSLAGRGLLANAFGPADANHRFIDLFLQADPLVVNQPWNSAAGPAMDAVMFNLGANDWHAFGEGPPPAAAFEATFVAFAQRVWAAYPRAHIYLTLVATDAGDERTTFATYLQNIVASLRSQGQFNAHYLAFTPALGLACWGHPDAALHRQMAGEMAAQIALDLGWNFPAQPMSGN